MPVSSSNLFHYLVRLPFHFSHIFSHTFLRCTLGGDHQPQRHRQSRKKYASPTKTCFIHHGRMRLRLLFPSHRLSVMDFQVLRLMLYLMLPQTDRCRLYPMLPQTHRYPMLPQTRRCRLYRTQATFTLTECWTRLP